MRKAIFIFIGGMLFGAAAYAIPYRLTRERAVTTTQINNFFQVAVDRGAWPGANTDIDSLCGYRTPTGGLVVVKGSRSGSDVQMGSDRAQSSDHITVE